MTPVSIRHFPLFLALQWHLAVHCGMGSSTFLVAAQGINVTEPSGERDGLADFGQTVPILDKMERTDQDFKDGLALDLFSPRNLSLIVNKNSSPLPGNFVSGSTGEPFVALSNYSWIVKVNDTARDLIAKVELPYDPEDVKRRGCDVANTYVGVLSGDGKSWKVDESRRNVHVSENKTRIIKLTSLDGEYILLGRQTIDTANIFVQYGFGATRTVNVTGGKGVQQVEFVDGLRFAVESNTEMKINVILKNGIDPKAIPNGMRSLYSFSWAVNSSVPNQQLTSTSVRFPVNLSLFTNSNTQISIDDADVIVAKRNLNAASSTAFEPIIRRQQKVKCRAECEIEVFDLQQVDNEYVILTSDEKKSKFGEALVEGQISNSTTSSVGTTLHRDSRWMGTLMRWYLCAALIFTVI